MTAPAHDWNGHVIVCGLHGVGMRTVEQLCQADVQVVVIDEHPVAADQHRIERWNVPLVIGSSRVRETLDQAGLSGARAVVCVDEDELHTLETALLVQELRPDVRVVCDIANAPVARAVIGVTGPGSVLDVAELSAPSMVEASLQLDVHTLDIEGTPFVVEALLVESETTLREQYGHLAPVAVVSPDGGDIAVCPGRDQPVHVGETVHLIGTADQFESVGGRLAHASSSTARKTGRLTVLRHAVTSVYAEADRSLRAALIALAVLVVIATTVLLIGYRKSDGSHMSLIDGVYFSVETIGTIGYGDFSFADQSPWLRVFAIGLMISGVLLAAIFFALLTNLLVSRRIEESLGRRNLTRMTGHIIVVGLGAVGMRVVEGIRARGVDVVVIDNDETNRYLGQARALKVPILIGDATQPVILDAAILGSARGVAVMTSDDLTNIETGLVMRDRLGARWHDVPIVLRVFDRSIGRTVERDFGFRHVRSTAALAAPWFVAAALGLDVIGSFSVGPRPFLVGRLPVRDGLVGRSMSELSGRTRVIAIRRAGANELEHPPRRGTRFTDGDVAYFVGPYEELIRVLRRDITAMPPEG